MDTSIWMMDSEYCSECGTALSPFESDLCYDCQQDQWWNEDQDYYDAWDYEEVGREDVPNTVENG